MTPNTTPEKPEWFQLTDGDAPSAQVKKVDKKVPAIAVLVTGAVIASGAFFANASEKNESHNNLQQSQLSTNGPLTQNDGALNGAPSTGFTPATDGSPQTSQILPPGGAGVTQPALPAQGMQPPVPGLGGDDDDDDDDRHEGRRFHHDDDDDDDEDDEDEY